MTYSLHGSTLRIDQRVKNRGTEPMPFGVGFHPYFLVRDADKKAAKIDTKAKRAFDNTTKKTIDVTGPIDLTQKEVDLHLLDHDARECTLAWPAGTLKLRGSAAYSHWVVWTLAGRDFVCLEPWTSPGNAVNTGDRAIALAPGAAKAFWLEMTFKRTGVES
jgi:galactose mutarotase-like enzyme